MNVLVNAFRADAPQHGAIRSWMDTSIQSDGNFGYSEHVLSGFIRIVTHPRIFDPPTPLDPALEFADALRRQPNAVHIRPGPRHWEIFRRLCVEVDARGNLVPDAYLAALAIESGSEWVTTDRDYARFTGLRLEHPFMR